MRYAILLPSLCLGLCWSSLSAQVVLTGAYANVYTTNASNGSFIVAADLQNIYELSTGGQIGKYPLDGSLPVLFDTGLARPTKAALGPNGDLFVISESENQLVKVSVQSRTHTVIATGLSNPAQVAVDNSGNAYIADSGNNRILVVSPQGTQTTLGAGIINPKGVAIGPSGDVFASDNGQRRIVKISPQTGAITPVVITPPLRFVGNIDVDYKGDIFFEGENPAIYELPANTTSYIGIGGVEVANLRAIDPLGTVFISDEPSRLRTLAIEPPGPIRLFFGPSCTYFGSPNCNYSSTSITYQITSDVTLGNAIVTTEGVQDDSMPTLANQAQDFRSVGGCSGTFNAGSTCSVTILFQRKYPGLRRGAVQLVDSSGKVLTTTNFYGIGYGPQMAFDPGVLSTLGSGYSGPQGLFATGKGDVYFADSGSGQILKIPAAGGAATPVANGLNAPTAIAFDGAGNLFVAEAGANRVVKIAIAGGAITTIGSGFSSPQGVAVDGTGNVFVSDSGNKRIVEVTSDGVQKVIAQGLLGPKGIAVDGPGNVYVADSSSQVLRIAQGTGAQTTIGSNLNQPSAVSIGSQAQVFIADSGNGRIVRVLPDGTQQTMIDGLSMLQGVSVDGTGDVFATDAGANRVVKLDRTNLPILTFADTPLYATSSDSPQRITAENIGYSNGAFYQDDSVVNFQPNFQRVSGPGNPPECVLSIVNGTILSIPAASSCNVSVSFIPQVTGSLQAVQGFANFSIAASGTRLTVKGNSIPLPANAPLVTPGAFGALRNDFTGFVGMRFTVGPAPLQVYALGRIFVTSNTGTHTLKLVNANTGVDVPGGSASDYLPGGVNGQYKYATLASPLTLQANTDYYLVSQETSGGDKWYNYGPVAPTNAVTVLGPAYADTTNVYNTVNIPGQAYGPVGLLYAIQSTSLSATITSPTGGIISGSSVPVIVATTGAVTSLQLQVDGTNRGNPVTVPANQSSPYALSLDTTSLSNGPHTIGVLAADGGGNSAPSGIVTVTVSNSTGVASAPLITSQTPGPIRNNFGGFVGMKFTVGSTPLVVNSLGRILAPGNTGMHLLKLVNATTNADVPGGSATVATAGGTAGQYRYGQLANAVTLQANTSYYLLSQDQAGGDQWYDFGPVISTNVGNINGPAYQDQNGTYNTLDLPGQAYVPVNLLYGSQTQPVTPLGVIITSPAAGTTVSGSIAVAVSTTGAAVSLQLQVDGANKGSAVPVSSNQTVLTLDTTTLDNGPHSLAVVVSDGQGGSAQSNSVSLTVDNTSPGGSSTSFLTGQTPGAARNNFTGYVGMKFTVGNSPLTVTSLGRIFLSGNTGTHTVKLVNANDGSDVPGGSVTVATTGGTPGQYRYATLASPVTLSANTSYYLLSQETAGGDTWYDYGPVATTNVAVVNGPSYQDGNGTYNTLNLPGQAYVPVSFTYGSNGTPTNPAPGGTSLITAQSPGALRNNFTGFVGFAFTTGGTPLTVTSLGRMYAPGNTGNHLVKLVTANNADVPGGSVTISLAGGTAGQYTYGTLAAPITLTANTTYYLVTQETAGGDQWFDVGPVTPANTATIPGPTYLDAGNPTITYNVVTTLPNQAYGPVNLTYQ